MLSTKEDEETLHSTLQTAASMPLPQSQSHSPSLSRPQLQQQHPQQQSSPSLVVSESNSQPQSPQSLHPLVLPFPGEFAQGEDIQTTVSKNVILSPTQIGSSGSQLISPVNEVRKRTGRRVLHRPRPLDLENTKLHWRSSQQHAHSQSQSHLHQQQQQQQQSQSLTATGSTESRPGSAFPIAGSASGTSVGQDVATPKGQPKHKAKFPLLHIRTDLNPTSSFRRTPTTDPTTSQGNPTEAPLAAAGNGISTNYARPRKELSKWQVGLERMLKKIQRRKRAPSNLMWYAAHSTASYLSGSTVDARSDISKAHLDTDAVEGLYYEQDKPPQWVVDSLHEDADLFFSDDTVELMLGLRDYLIKATENGWDIAELKEEIFPIDPKSIFLNRRNRSVSPLGSPRRTSSSNFHAHTSAPASPCTAASHDSPGSSRRGSRGSFEFDYMAVQHAVGRYADEEAGSYRLLDYFMAILSDIISHDCRYRVQHPRPTRPEWVLHSIVLDILFFLTKVLAHDHKAIYDVGMIALSAFPVFQNHALVRLLDLLTEMILPSFALSRTQPYGTSLSTHPMESPPSAPLNPGSPISPSEIRVQLNNNQTFAIQVHSPTEEQTQGTGQSGMLLSVPGENNCSGGSSGSGMGGGNGMWGGGTGGAGGQSLNSLGSPRIPSSRSSSTSLSRSAAFAGSGALSGPLLQAQDTMDTHASSLISLTLLAVLQQISFTKSPLPVVKQLQKSIGSLLRIKPNLSKDLLEVIAIVENEKVMGRALEVLWWVGRASVGHHVLSEKFFALDYESALVMRQQRSHLQELSSSPGSGSGGGVGSAGAGRSNTVKSDTLFSFRRGSLDDSAATPRNDSLTTRNNSAGTFGPRSKRSYRPSLPWKSAHVTEALPLIALQQEKQQQTTVVVRTDYLVDHELYPFLYSSSDKNDHDTAYLQIHCERCEMAMRGFGLHCYHCRGALHLECFYSVKRFAGIDCLQPCCALDVVSRRPRNQLMYPDEGEPYGDNNQIYKIRAGHHLQMVNLFSTCLCVACKLPLWGHHHQGYRCGDCGQLMHLDCNGPAAECMGPAPSQPLAHKNLLPTLISLQDLKESFLEYYGDLISTWEKVQTAAATNAMGGSSPALGMAGSSTSTASLASPVMPTTSSTHSQQQQQQQQQQLKDRSSYSYEEASCNASALTLQLELLKAGVTRGEVQVHEWMQQDQQSAEQNLVTVTDFELIKLQKYFTDLVTQLQEQQQHQQQQQQPGSIGSLGSGAGSIFLADFFEDAEPDTFLLFSARYWSHFAAVTNTMIKDVVEAPQSQVGHRHQHLHQNYFPSSTESGGIGLHQYQQHRDDIFAFELDSAQSRLLEGHSVQAAHVSLASIFRFCMRRLGFQSAWTMQVVLQEWVKIGLLERLDGELCLFEKIGSQEPKSPALDGVAAPIADPSATAQTNVDPSTTLSQTRYPSRRPKLAPTIQTSYFDNFGNCSTIPMEPATTPGSITIAAGPTGLRNVHCLFPTVSAIDPTPDVENLIHSIWRCLSSVDLSINECGFLLLTRQCWPDPFMSDYTTERLMGCIFHWWLLEDDHLFVIHKKYASRGKRIPGVRSDLEEQMGRKRTAALSEINANVAPAATTEGGVSATAATAASSSGTPTGHTTSSMAATTSNTSTGTNINTASRTSSINSNLFGAVGSYVMTRKLMAKKFALPWLSQAMNLDPERYLGIVYRQIRVLEREMAPEEEGQGFITQEEHQKFRQTQAERYLEFITKLRQAGFLFNMFSSVLCHWLNEVQEMLGDLDISSKTFKNLNRLFMKASNSSNASRGGSGLGSGLGLGIVQSNGHPVLGGQTTAPALDSDRSAVETGSGLGARGEDSEWRSRLKAKLYQGSGQRSGISQSPSSSDTTFGDPTESPLNSLRMMLRRPQDSTNNFTGGNSGDGIDKAIFWLSMMVQSGVQIPVQAFLECCEGLVNLVESPMLKPIKSDGARTPGQSAPVVIEGISLEVADTAPLSALVDDATSVLVQPRVTNLELLQQSRDFLRTCWEHIVISAHRMSETEAGEILETVLMGNETTILKTMNDRTQFVQVMDLDSVRELLKYALAIAMYEYGCPLHIILSLEIAPVSSNITKKYSQQSRGHLPLQQQLHHRQQHHSTQQLQLDRESIPIALLLKSLRSASLSLQGEVVKSLAVILEHAGRVSNIDEFVDSIHKEMIPCLWELLSPLNDHLVDTTLPLLMRFISHCPAYFHRTVARYFHDHEWETRFSALDSVFSLFSKLDDALVLKLFFQQTIANTSPVGTMLSGKGKAVERGQRQRDRHQYQQQKKTGINSLEPDTNESSGTGLSGQGGQNTFTGLRDEFSLHQETGEPISHGKFLADHLEMLGPAFSFFVSSMWDKEEAVRTKAKTLLKSLQPVHVDHALKAWELHFIASTPDAQQTLLKLMTRLNNYFPSWKIMDYELIFKLLTSGGLGRFVPKDPNALASSCTEGDSAASFIRGPVTTCKGSSETNLTEGHPQAAKVFIDQRSRRASFTSLSMLGTSSGRLSGAGNRFEPEQPHHQQQKRVLHRRSGSFDSSAVLNAPVLTAYMPASDPSRSHQRASIISSARSASTSMPSSPILAAEAEAREKQLALEDDIHCSLLNLALQMIANGIEPRLDEVIQLKYLVVFYLDFEGCELLSLGQGKFQVRYGEYIPRQRMSPIHGAMGDGENGGIHSANALLNDPGHENFVLVICRNLQLILDRFVEIKPDHERDAPTLYDQPWSRDENQFGGNGISGYEGAAMQSDPQIQTSSGAGRTFSATTTTTMDQGKESTKITTSSPQYEEDDWKDGEQHSRQGLFCFPRQKHHRDNHQEHPSDSYNKASTASQKNQYQQNYRSPYGQHGIGMSSAAPRYQQHHHHHYRRNQNRRMDESTPVVGTYFVDVILRFFGSETDLSVLPAGRLKDWLELLLVVVYKYVKEVDPLSDLVVVLMKRIVEMLMVKRIFPAVGNGARGSVGSTHHLDPNARGGPTANGANVSGAGANGSSAAGEESMSEENILLSISICSTLLKRSSTMTTALLSREIMAMGRLMTRRRDDPEDPVLIRAKNFLHDAFVHFMGNGLFVLVFKTQPAYNTNSFSWEDERREVDNDLDLFYVLATVLGESEMVSQDPTSTVSAANTRLVYFRDQPIRDILDRVMIFRDIEPAQVSTILTNLALYVERVHCKFEDPHLLPDMAQFLIKVTKYTAEWDHQQQQRQKEYLQQLRLVQEQNQHQTLVQQQQQAKQQTKRRTAHHLFTGNTSTMVSNGSTADLPLSQAQQVQQSQLSSAPQKQKQLHQQKQGVTSMTSGSTVTAATDPATTAAAPSSIVVVPNVPLVASGPPTETQGRTTVTSVTPTPTTATSLSTFSSDESPAAVVATTQPQDHQQTHQSTIPSSIGTESIPSQPASTPKVALARRKSAILKHMPSFDLESNPFAKSRNRRNSIQESTLSSAPSQQQQQQQQQQQSSSSSPPPSHPRHFRHLHPHRQPITKAPMQSSTYLHHWDYSNPVLNMCAILMIQNPLEGHHLVSAVKHVLRQALYRDKISAPVMIRLVTGYCYMAELDFSLSLVNVFGEFVVEELKTSIQSYAHSKYDDELTQGEDETAEHVHHMYGYLHRHGHPLFRKNGKIEVEKEKEQAIAAGGGGLGTGVKNVGLGTVGLGGGVGAYSTGGRTKILAGNLHLLHHVILRQQHQQGQDQELSWICAELEDLAMWLDADVEVDSSEGKATDMVMYKKLALLTRLQSLILSGVHRIQMSVEEAEWIIRNWLSLENIREPVASSQ
ncbi:hypothetical protein EDD11_002982 [Mortierella claussenii]|nr:hypothetical protein EDD11_002982 [Mortierella claussenii]